MLNSQTSKKQGFTIIEVVLVLAVAGLIFLMIFLAIPALQRAQRDNGRKRSVGLVVAAIQNWRANNKGRSLFSEIRNEISFEEDPESTDEETGRKLRWVKAVDRGVLDNYLTLDNNRNDDGRSHLSSDIKEVRIVSNNIGGDINLYHYIPGRTPISVKQQRIVIYPSLACPNGEVKRNRNLECYKLPRTSQSNNAVLVFLENGGIYCENT